MFSVSLQSLPHDSAPLCSKTAHPCSRTPHTSHKKAAGILFCRRLFFIYSVI
jgi:hypothetical protein